ncbi:MAG: FtsX-like permease family protein [Treponema sp.]|jgi:putative ABC transport system permease protein|nr:FtsX-like permease family protein [Treponema sp.]
MVNLYADPVLSGEKKRAKKRSHFGKTYGTVIIREIRSSLGRFLAIFAIVALGVGFLSGLLATTPDMKASVDRYFDHTNMMDLSIKATMGISTADLDALAQLDEVALVQGAYVMDALVKTSREEELVTRIYGLPLETLYQGEFVNRVELLTGRMPEQEDECLVQEPGGFLVPIPIGTILSISDESLDYAAFTSLDQIYTNRTFTVTGIVKSPLYISTEREPSAIGNGRLGMVMYIRESVYALPAYTDCYITLKDARPLRAFTPPYQTLVDQSKSTIEALGRERSEIRREVILTEASIQAQGQLAHAETEYEHGRITAEQKLAAARKELDQGATELAAGEEELAAAETRLAQGRAAFAANQRRVAREMQDTEEMLNRGAVALVEAQQTLQVSKAQLDAVQVEVEKTRASFFKMLFPKARRGVAEYDAGRAALETGVSRLRVEEAELRKARTLLEAGKSQAAREFSQAQAELIAGEQEIAEARRKLTEAQAALAAGEAAYKAQEREARQALQAGAAALVEARKQMEELSIETPRWYVLDRNTNMGCINYQINAEKIADVAKVFPLFFLLIAVLVALTTMTRMVEEDRIPIGTLKALGYKKRVILYKYLVYGGLTGVLGCLVGMVSGFQGLPIIIYRAFATRYHLPPLVTEFNWFFGLIACALVLSCTLGATVYAAYHTLWEKPASLLLPRPPQCGKRIFLEYLPWLWTRMRFTHKVTARNLIRQKKHFFMTVTGIAGCTALMVAAFGLRDSMIDIARTQFEEILRYDVQLDFSLQEGAFPELPPGIPLRRRLPIHSEAAVLSPGTDTKGSSISLVVPQNPEALGEYITLRDRKTRGSLPFSATSVVLTEKIAETWGLKLGDKVVLENAAGRRGSFTLSGITENYVGATVYLGPTVYTQEFGGTLVYQTLFAYTDPAGALQDELMADLLSHKEVSSVEFIPQVQASYTTLLDSIGFVVLVLIFAAGGLAMIVLYNLTNINITERTREIATLRVLGFRQAEAAAYIFREITLLSIIGAGVGLLLGIPLHRFIIGVAENADLMFGRRIAPLSFGFSAALTLVFSGGVDLLMLKKLGHITLADSLKAPD